MNSSFEVNHLASQILKVEQQLRAYEKLHAGELSELWQTLNDCKQAIAEIIGSTESFNFGESNDSVEAKPVMLTWPADQHR